MSPAKHIRRASGACALIAAITTAASADLHAVGHEFRPTLEQRTATDRCTNGGITAEARIVCRNLSEARSCESYNRRLVAWWRDGSGNVVHGPFILAERFSSDAELSFACNQNGKLLVVFDYTVQTVDRDGSRGPLHSVPYGSAATDWRDGFFVAWPVSWPLSGVRGRFFAGSGEAASEEIQISTVVADRVAAASDDDDSVVVAWNRGSNDPEFGKVEAVLLEGESVAGLPIRLSDFPHLDWSVVVIYREAPGQFVVSWDNDYQAGWVARRVTSKETQTTTTTSTTTSTLSFDVPEFAHSGKLAEPFTYDLDHPPFQPTVAGDRAGRWLASWPDQMPERSSVWPFFGSLFATSTDDGRHWSETASVADGSFRAGREIAVATDHRGDWVMAWAPPEEPWILTRRSEDGGRTWSTSTSHPSLVGAERHRLEELSVAAGENGVWVIAWIESQPVSDYESGPCATFAAVSTDSGESWQNAREIGRGRCTSLRRGLEVATDRHGNWRVAWISGGISGVTSSDNAGTWTDATVLVTEPSDPSSLDLAADGFGSWLLTFAATRFLPTGASSSTRIFVSRSRDGTDEWSTPVGIAPWDDADGGLDDSPSVASGGRNSWGIVWRTHSDADGNGLDGDIVASFSSDAGEGWSAPRLVDAQFRNDTREDGSPNLAYAGANTWIALWKTWERKSRWSDWEGSIRFARTRGDCGNGDRDLAEECDDGNVVDDDGCDSNCLVTSCGNAVAAGAEQCDDGNGDDTDECTTICRAAACGDGFIEEDVERCDDGNLESSDACTSACVPSRCGDGILWNGVEECDDANFDNNDGCLRDCRSAVCGDGYLRSDTETCDDGNDVAADGCSDRCRLENCPGLSGRRTTAAAALRVLKRAVGMDVRCRPQRCDRDNDGRVTADDALDTLRLAVSSAVVECDSISSVLVRLVSEEPMAAFQFTLRYSDAPGSAAGVPTCTELTSDDVLTAVHIDTEWLRVNAGFLSLPGFRGPTDLIRCEFPRPIAPSTHAFAVTIEDAVDSNGDALDPLPKLRMISR